MMKLIGENKFKLQCDVRTLGTHLIMHASNMVQDNSNMEDMFTTVMKEINSFLVKSKQYENKS